MATGDDETPATPPPLPKTATPPAVSNPRGFAEAVAAAAPSSKEGVAACAATGWQDVYNEVGVEGEQAAAGGASPQPAASPQQQEANGESASLPVDANGCLPFYLIDAYENPDRAGAQVWEEGHLVGM